MQRKYGNAMMEEYDVQEIVLKPIVELVMDAMKEDYDFQHIVLKPIMELVIDSMLTAHVSIEEYQNKFVVERFSQKYGIDFDRILALVVKGFSQKRGVDLIELFS